MWWGFQKGINYPANDPTYARMAEVGLPASVHVAQPFFNKEHPEAHWTAGRTSLKTPEARRREAHMGCMLFDSDLTSRPENPIPKDKFEAYAAQYDRTVRFLETGDYISGSNFLVGTFNWAYRGLNLPRSVLEKIYYRNALRIYPGLGKALKTMRKEMP